MSKFSNESFDNKTLLIDSTNHLSAEEPDFKERFNLLQRWKIWWLSEQPLNSAEEGTKSYCLRHVIKKAVQEWKKLSKTDLKKSELQMIQSNLNILRIKAHKHNRDLGVRFLSLFTEEVKCYELEDEIKECEALLSSR